jgi:hypothetical protein
MKRFLPLLAMLAFMTGSHTAGAVSVQSAVSGGSTALAFTIDLDALDVEVEALGDTHVDGSGRFVLPITSGDVTFEPLAGSIEHEDSGLRFSFGSVDLDVEHLRFDFDDRTVSGDLSVGPFSSTLDIFDLVACVDGGCTGPGGTVPITGFGLFLRTDAADAFENLVFGDDRFDDGDQIALAQIEIAAVPEPAALVLLGTALTGLATLRRKSA